MKRNKKGISLITLVITIIIMIILAGAIVLTLTQSGVFDKANEATGEYNLQQVQKIAELAWAEAYADGERDVTKLQDAVDKALADNKLTAKYKAIADEKGVTVKEKVQGSGVNTEIEQIVDKDGNNIIGKVMTENTAAWDKYGNKIVVPAGFKIRVDEVERTKGDANSTATNVTQGIVIEDCTETSTKGSQFVWVPVGTIYTNVEQTESRTITLGRYQYDSMMEVEENYVIDYIPNEYGIYTPFQAAEDYSTINSVYGFSEDTAENHNPDAANVIARNIGDFVTSALQNKGYYIGRYEAGNVNDTLVCKAGQNVYNNITQPDSANLCKNMYNSGNDGYKANTFSSDLINSYAWDTAIIFIQTFGGPEVIDYYKQNKSTIFTSTGGNGDEYCNINDMSGNASEWSTETASTDCVWRGGWWGNNDPQYQPVFDTSTRVWWQNYASTKYSFRPIIYVAEPK